MLIRVGGQRWIVESSYPGGRSEASASFVHLTFRRVDAEDDRLELGWAPRFEPLDPEAARNLFALAGRRRWTDQRSARRYDVELLPSGPDERPWGALRIRFATEGGDTVSTIYPLSRPLGLAMASELEAMLDVAIESRVRSDGLRPRFWSVAPTARR